LSGLKSSDPALREVVAAICRDDLDSPELRGALTSVLGRSDLGGGSAAKVGYLVLDLADRLELSLPDHHRSELERLRRRADVLDQEAVTIAAALAATGVDYLLLRAAGLARFYPPTLVREHNDLDILLRDEHDVGRVLKSLTAVGYYLARPIVARAERAGVWLGIALNKQVSGLGHAMYLDLATLGPGLSRSRCLTLPAAAWNQRERIERAHSEFPVLDRHWQAVTFGVELVERGGAYVLRDLVDLVMLSRSGVDWSLVSPRLAAHPEAGRALRDLALQAGPFGVPDPFSALTRPEKPRRAWQRVPRGWRDATVAASDAVIRAVRHRRPTLARRLVERIPVRGWFRAGLPIFLLPTAPGESPAGRAPINGLDGFRAVLFPLVAPGMTARLFGPSPDSFRLLPAQTDRVVPAQDRWVSWILDRQEARTSLPELDGDYLARRIRAGIAVRDVALAETAGGWAASAFRASAHPITGRREVTIQWLAASAPDPLDRLLASLDARGLLDSCTVVVEAEPDLRTKALAQYRFAPQVLTVRHQVVISDAEAIPPVDNFRLEPAQPEDYPFVLDCLATALRRGLAPAEQHHDVTGWARSVLPPHRTDSVCLIGFLGDQRVCHGLGYPRADRYSDRTVLYLLDVFVVPEHHDMGLARAATMAVMAEAARQGYATVESDVVLGPESELLRTRLRTAGWAEDRIRWSRRC
jgi:hypothetical protein